MKFTTGPQAVIIDYDFDFKTDDKELWYEIDERFELEISKIKGVLSVNVVMGSWFECRLDYAEEIKQIISSNYKKWINDEIEKRIKYYEECIIDDSDFPECVVEYENKIEHLKSLLY